VTTVALPLVHPIAFLAGEAGATGRGLHPALPAAWAALVIAGGALSCVVRRRDRSRREWPERSPALRTKFVSYVCITGALLVAGTLSVAPFALLLAIAGLAFARELLAAGRRAPPIARDRVCARGIALIAAGLAGAFCVKLSDPCGNAWGWLWLVVATTDAFSQLFGQGWGSRPMAASLSPGKTWEGFAGGTLAAVVVGLSLSVVIPRAGGPARALLALATSLGATAGDLVESAGKRALGIKDFSDVLGAHGGLLDRFDSLLGAAPVFAVMHAVLA
jgi:phosphatidate cytidylyltransferase